MEFSDKVAIITGVAGGIGLATATMLGEQGATVIGWDFQEERLEQARKALQARNIERKNYQYIVSFGQKRRCRRRRSLCGDKSGCHMSDQVPRALLGPLWRQCQLCLSRPD